MPDSLIETLEREPAPAEIGPVAALSVALAAGVIGEAARLSAAGWDDAAGVVAQAAALRRRAIRLAREDREAHLVATGALAEARRDEHARGGTPLATALTRAADLPLEIAEAATDVAALAALVAEEGSPDRSGDATGAALLAAGAVGAAAQLIEVNLATSRDDPRLARAAELRTAAEAYVDRGKAASA